MGGVCPLRGHPGLTFASPSAGRLSAGYLAGPAGARGGWGRLSAPVRPRSAPLSSSVTMDISRLRRRPLLALGETPLGRQLHRRPGDQLG